MITTAQIIASNLQRLRLRAGLTQQELADAMQARGQASWFQSTIYKAENFEKPGRKITLEEGVALGEIFGVDAAALTAPLDSTDDGWGEFHEAGVALAEAMRTLLRVAGWVQGRIDGVTALSKRLPPEGMPLIRSDIDRNTDHAIVMAIADLQTAIEIRGWRGAKASAESRSLEEFESLADESGVWHDVPKGAGE